MFKSNFDKRERFSLRKYKSVGVASALIGISLFGTSVSAAEVTRGVDQTNGVTTITSENSTVKLKDDHVTIYKSTNAETSSPSFKDFDKAATISKEDEVLAREESIRKDEVTETYTNNSDLIVNYKDSDDRVIKDSVTENISNLNIDKSKSVTTEVKGEFGRVLKSEDDKSVSNEDIKANLKDVAGKDLSPDVISKNDKTYHKIDTVVTGESEYSKDVNLGDITVKASVDKLYNANGSINYSNIKTGSKIWVLEESGDGKYDRYTVINKDDSINSDEDVVNAFKNASTSAKKFSKAEVDANGGILKGDHVLVVERNTFARLDVASGSSDKLIGDKVTNLTNKKIRLDATGYYEGIINMNEVNATGSVLNIPKVDVEKQLAVVKNLSVNELDSLNRPRRNYISSINGSIGQDVYNDVNSFKAALSKVLNFESGLSKSSSDYDIEVEYTLANTNKTEDEIKEMYKSELAGLKSADYLSYAHNIFTQLVIYHNDAINLRKTIQYDTPSEMDDVTYSKYVIEYNAIPRYDGTVSNDYNKIYYDFELTEANKDNFKIYGEYTKDGVKHRRLVNWQNPINLKTVFNGFYDTEYRDIYSVNRIYKVADGSVKVTNVYSEEKTYINTSGSKFGHAKVRYVDANGREIFDSKSTEPKNVSVETVKYYLDKNNEKHIVSKISTSTNEMYDVSSSTYKLKGINASDGAYVLDRTDGNESGSLVEGENVVTYVYRKVEPKVVTEKLEPKVVYAKDSTREKGSENVTETGKAGTKVTTTTYTVNEKTGKVEEHVGQPVVTNATNTVVKVAAQDKVTYVKKGNDVVKVTTVYTVNETTGVITEKSSEEVVTKDGAKDKVVTEKLEPKVVYTKDSTREKGSENVTETGKAGTKVTTTTYTVNEKTGEVEEHVGEPVITNATNTVVKVAAQDKVTYVKKGNDVVKVTTVYTVNETTGVITEKSSEEVVTKDGVKDKVLTENIEPKVVYAKDSTREKGSENVTEKGKVGTKVTTTTYTVNEKTGKVEEHVGQPVVTNATNTVVKVAAQDKVTYMKKGNDVVKMTTVYTVNETTGAITEKSSEEVVTKDGAKDKVVTENIEPKVVYSKDSTREKGSENVTEKGKTGTKVTTTIYTVNEKTAKVEEHVGQPVVTNATNTVVKVAAQDKVTYVKKGNDVVKVTTVYTVNETTGVITEKSSEEVVTKDGAKDKVVTENIEPKVVYIKDSTREKGSENVTETGKAGTKVTTTTYTVNEKTGKVEEHVGEPVITNATNTVVKVAAQDKVTYVKKGDDVVKVTTVYTVNETTGVITEKSSEEVVEQNVTPTNNTRADGPVYSAPIGVVPTAVNKVDGYQSKVDINSTYVVKEATLPNTGGGDSSILSLLGGLSLTSILGVASEKRKDEE